MKPFELTILIATTNNTFIGIIGAPATTNHNWHLTPVIGHRVQSRHGIVLCSVDFRRLWLGEKLPYHLRQNRLHEKCLRSRLDMLPQLNSLNVNVALCPHNMVSVLRIAHEHLCLNLIVMCVLFAKLKFPTDNHQRIGLITQH